MRKNKILICGAKHLSVVEGKMSLLYKEVNELLVVETKGATVEPHEEGGLWAPWLYLWNIIAAVVNDIVDVVLDVLQHFLAPLFAFGRESRKVIRQNYYATLMAEKKLTVSS